MKGLKITNIDFSDCTIEQRFEIEHDASSPMCLLIHFVDKNEGEGLEGTITLRACEMKALGKALVFAAEYVEGLYNE